MSDWELEQTLTALELLRSAGCNCDPDIEIHKPQPGEVLRYTHQHDERCAYILSGNFNPDDVITGTLLVS